MRLKRRRELLEEINNAFIDFIKEYRGTRYVKYFKAINNEIIERRGEVTTNELRSIIKRETDNVNFEDVAVFAALLGAITQIIENKRMSRDLRDSLAPVLLVVGLYSLAKPKVFVDKVYKSLKNPQSATEKKAHKSLLQYKKENEVMIKRIDRKLNQDLQRSQMKAKLPQSKVIIEQMRQMSLENKPIDMQRQWLQKEYNGSKTMMRALDTETHSSLESGKLEQAKFEGWTTKVWRTQGDDRVRRTRWHNFVSNKKIDLEDDFKLGTMVASAPGDVRLPAGERINCRCYLIFQ